MPLLKAQKLELAKRYHGDALGARNVVVVKHQGIPVNQMNAMRSELDDAEGRLEIVKKRVFLKSIEADLPGCELDAMEGSVAVLYSYNEDDQHAPLKVIQKHSKLWKKDKKEFTVDYVGGWYDKVWQDGAYVTELANLPSKEELIGKLLYMLNHPVSSMARVFKAIADASGEPVAEETVEEAAPAEEQAEQPAEETPETPEAPAEEAQAEEQASEEAEAPAAEAEEAPAQEEAEEPTAEAESGEEEAAAE